MKAFLMSMILSSVPVLGSSPSFANSGTCARAIVSVFDLDGRIEVEDKASRGPKASEYKARILLVESLIGNLVSPAETRVVVGDLTIFSVFDRNDFSVYVGIQPVKAFWKGNKVDVDTLNHEYAHAIFEKNLLLTVPNFKERYAVIDSRAVENDPSVILYTALHELFADVVTVTTTKNSEVFPGLLADSPEALKSFEDGMGNPQREFTFDELNFRSMTLGRNPGARDSWKKLIQEAESRQHPYFILMPTRWKFWDLVEAKIVSPQYQKEIIEKVFSILKEEVEQTLIFSKDSLNESDIQDINHRLIEQLEQVL